MKSYNAHPTTDTRVLLKKLFKLERRGRYAEALDLIREDEAINANRFGIESAEFALRYGSLIGFNGHEQQIDGSQQLSKDLLMRSRDEFVVLGDPEKIAECENYIALTYWRTGEFREANVWLDEAAAHELPLASNSRLQNFHIRSLILLSCLKHEENISFCRSIESDVRTYGDAFLIGGISTNLAISLKDTDHKAQALDHFIVGRRFLEQAKHRTYLGTVENNLALLYKDLGSFALAHDSVDSAIKIYKRIKDKTREGSSLETKAQVSLAERQPKHALEYADRSVAVLRKSENAAYLAESLMTRAKILIELQNFQDAVLSMMEAVDITRERAGEDAARSLIDDFQSAYERQRRQPVEAAAVATGDLELIVPTSLSAYTNFRGVWIANPYFEDRGLARGSLAIVVDEAIRPGDLVAATDRRTDEVLCGVYDSDFGMICLETEPGQPQLFDEKDISVVGRIVGVCRDARAGGKMQVEPLIPVS